MKPPIALADKGDLVEEWADRKFFRPLGYVVCQRLLPTRVTPDQVTVVSLVLGLVAGNLFFYDSRWVNLAGVLLFVVSDIFDSADGQLARTRGTSTPFGRVVDGVSDNLRFINLYLTLIARLVVSGHGWQAVGLGVAAGVSHALQSTAVDTIRQAYLYLGAGKGSELDLPEVVAGRPRPSGWRVFAAAGLRELRPAAGPAAARHVRPGAGGWAASVGRTPGGVPRADEPAGSALRLDRAEHPVSPAGDHRRPRMACRVLLADDPPAQRRPRGPRDGAGIGARRALLRDEAPRQVAAHVA